MKPQKCQNCGMFYDADKYALCPHCNEQQKQPPQPPKPEPQPAPPVTPPEPTGKGRHTLFSRKPKTHADQMPQPPVETPAPEPERLPPQPAPDEERDVFSSHAQPQQEPEQKPADAPSGEEMGSLAQAVAQTDSAMDSKTVAFYNFSNETNPVVGWLVCVKGEYLGESFQIVSGQNNIGRSLTNNIALAKERTISRERHAAIIFEPNQRRFFLQSGGSSGLTYLNGEVLIGVHELTDRDRLMLGGAEFLFVQLCGDAFSWDDYTEIN